MVGPRSDGTDDVSEGPWKPILQIDIGGEFVVSAAEGSAQACLPGYEKSGFSFRVRLSSKKYG